MKLNYKLSTALLCITLTFSGCGLSSANRSYGKALDAYEQGNYEKASGYFEDAIKENKDKAEYHIDYGFNLIQIKNYEAAIAQFSEIIMDKDIKMVRENNKRAYRGIGIAYLAMNDVTQAIDYFTQALNMSELPELDRDLLYYKASAVEKSGDYNEAIEIYTKILEAVPEDATLLSARANAYRMIKEYEKSIADYDKAISIDENKFDLYFGKFAALKELKRDSEAVEALEKASLITCVTEAQRFELAKVHFYQAKFDYAVTELQNCAEVGYTESYFFLGEIYLNQQDYENALTMYQEYVQSGNSVSAMLYNQMLTCSLKLKDYEKAEGYLKKAKLLSDPSIQNQLLKNEIVYLEQTGQFEEALTKMQDFLAKYPEDEQANKDYYFLSTRVEGAKQNVQTTSGSEVTVEKP